MAQWAIYVISIKICKNVSIKNIKVITKSNDKLRLKVSKSSS